MIFPPFAPKSLGDLDLDDLRRLIDDEIPEGPFIEYKSEWTSPKIARSVASFANNSGGGTLIIGIEADKLLPRRITGIENDGTLEERVVQVIRSSIAPVPSFAPRAVDIGGGRACLVVEVPEGTQPPYILVQTGRVLIRTPTSSEPIGIHDRDALDRLFLRGDRGRRWAREQAAALSPESSDAIGGWLWTVPAVEDGLACDATIFRESFVRALGDYASGWWIHPWATRQERTAQHYVSVTFVTVETTTTIGSGLHPPRQLDSMRVSRQGIVESSSLWVDESTLELLERMVKELLPRHATVLEDHLGHRGTAAVVLFGRGTRGEKHSESVRVVRPHVAIEELSNPAFHESLQREILRALHVRQVFEP